MGKWSGKKVGFILCAALLAFIVGCQSVGGLNLNEVILKQIDVTQQEQSQLLELEIDFNEQLLSEEEPELAQMIEAFKKFSLNIKHSKLDDKGNMWLTGEFSFERGEIPFTLHSDSKVLRFDLGGSSRPFIIEMDSSMGTSLNQLLPGFDMFMGSDSQQVMMDSVRKLVRNVASYFVNGLPNPPAISVSRVTGPINGVATTLNKVHAELNGEQLGELISVYLDNLVKDKEGFETMLRNFAQWAQELPPEMKEVLEGSEIFGEGFPVETFVEKGVAEFFPMLEEAQKELEAAREKKEWKEVFDKGITMTADVYVDDSLHLRKSSLEMKIAPAVFEQPDSPVRSITIRSSGEMWNVNGEVVVPAVEIPRDALTVEQLENMKPFQIVRLFDKDSVIYDILKNDLKADDQSFELSTEWGVSFYLDTNGDAFVPLRSTMTNFDVQTNYDLGTKVIYFYDEATAQTIQFRLGSNKAHVNGHEVTLDHKVQSDGHFVYASADDLFGLLRATYEITEYEDGESVMEVARDL
ncbi:stalk domain-containing protein [Cohnella sp.]|uniref:stalk domain-containing protein n=1 Tax=Cohnella sp. TaxID=1883426 RepID=UPI00356542BC